MNLNRSELIGNLTKDVELRQTKTGTNYVFYSVATNYAYTDKQSGELVKKVTFHDCLAHGKLAETIAKYGKKGMKVFIAGRIEKEPKEEAGIKYYVTRIVTSDFIMLSKSNNPYAPADDEIDQFANAEVKHEPKSYGATDHEDAEMSIEDVPF